MQIPHRSFFLCAGSGMWNREAAILVLLPNEFAGVRDMLRYPVQLTRCDDSGVILTLPDVPEVTVIGPTEEFARRCASFVLEGVLKAYAADGRPAPEPSQIPDAPTIHTRLH
jgi:predicted RNase H-like HicB family nuclease